jgi:hypothetical protein
MQALVQHSKNKDQFVKVMIKCMAETQLFEGELKEANEQNSIHFANEQELEAQLVEETRAKDGSALLVSLCSQLDHVRVYSELNISLFCSI